jgi:hypothetical protein
MAALVAAIHFPEAVQEAVGLWKMDGPDKPGHDGDKIIFRPLFISMNAQLLSKIVRRQIFSTIPISRIIS